jgi:hypothetical protein
LGLRFVAAELFMIYDDQIEAAIAAPTAVKGELLCVCKMSAKALRSEVVPRSLFDNRIERVISI